MSDYMKIKEHRAEEDNVIHLNVNRAEDEAEFIIGDEPEEGTENVPRGILAKLWHTFKTGADRGVARLERKEEWKANENMDVIVVTGTDCSDVEGIIRDVEKRIDAVGRVVSCTTRAPRMGDDNRLEVSGEDYFFVSERSFQQMEDEEQFLDKVRLNGVGYGVPLAHMQYLRLMGKRCLLIGLDTEGAVALGEKYGALTTVFVMPPERGEMEKRLAERFGLDEDEISDRLCCVETEIGEAENFDHIVMDDAPGQAADELERLIIDRFSRADRYASIDRIRGSYMIFTEDE